MTESRQQTLQRYLDDPSISNRNALVSAHRYLCKRGARKFFRGTVDRADLEQVAAIGLIKASVRYDRTYETPFEAYAWLMIVGELMHFVRDHERVIRIPRTLRALERRCRVAFDKLSSDLQREPSQAELAAELGVSLRELDETKLMRTQRFLEEEAEDGNVYTRESRMIRALASVEPPMCDVDDRIALASALRQLSERERAILCEIFFRDSTQQEVGQKLGISQRQVSRVLARTLQRLARLIAA